MELNSLLNIPVPLIVVLCSKPLRVEEILNFSPGAIIEFSKQSDQLLDVMVNDQFLARGEVVKVGEKFGIQIKDVISTQDKIRALGGE